LQAKKARVAAAKAEKAAAKKKRSAAEAAIDGKGAGATTPRLSKKDRKAAKKAASPAGPPGGGQKAVKAARFAEQNKRHQSNIVEVRAKRLMEMAGLVFEEPYEVFLKYLPHDVTAEQVTEHFEGCGEMAFPGPRVRSFPLANSRHSLCCRPIEWLHTPASTNTATALLIPLTDCVGGGCGCPAFSLHSSGGMQSRAKCSEGSSRLPMSKASETHWPEIWSG
jgi:hypothetical protein